MDEIAPSLAIEDVVKMTSDAEREKSPEHPMPDQTAIGGRTLAIESVEIDFIGKSSHAGLAPEDGINALDAAARCTAARLRTRRRSLVRQTI